MLVFSSWLIQFFAAAISIILLFPVFLYSLMIV
nr:MAG TPA: hypothetical protein [Bacteriophage sp.]